MEKYKLSIIIPHFNTPESLLKLIKSIPDRTEIQVIVVDDNSSVSLEGLKKELEKFPMVEFYLNDSNVKGAGASRNIGLKKAKGQWILFADADDYFVDDFYKKIELFLDSDDDIVYFPPTSIDVITNEISSRHVMYKELVEKYDKRRKLRQLTELKYGFCTPWSKLIKRSIFTQYQIAFDEIMVSNDIMCMTKCAFYAKNIGVSKDIIYCVTRGAKTLTSKKNEKLFDIRIDVLIDRYTFLKEHLTKKEFQYAHIDRLALGKLVDVLIDHWGIKKFFTILKKYHQNKVKYFDFGLLNPITLIHKAKIELAWWMDIKKHRKA